MDSQRAILPFYHPTTMVCVDDNAQFLASLSLQFDPQRAYLLYDSPFDALRTINAEAQATSFVDAGLCMTRSQLEHMQTLTNMSLVEQEISNINRFKKVSVVVVDYDMAGMDGLALCSQINHPMIQKVLLTGVADEKVAVRAFNAGLIDQYIPKSSPTMAEQLNDAINALQYRYFTLLSESFTFDPMFQVCAFLQQPGFRVFLQKLCRTHNFVEYYFCTDPYGFLLATDTGRLARLVVMPQSELNGHYDVVRDQGAPEALQSALGSRQYLPYFWASVDGFYHVGTEAWERFLFPASKVPGLDDLYYALVWEPESYRRLQEEAAGYDAYIDFIDTRVTSALQYVQVAEAQGAY